MYSVVHLREYRPKVLLAHQLHRGRCVCVCVCVCMCVCVCVCALWPELLVDSPFPFLQTLMVQVRYPMTVCTNSRAQKEIIAKVQISEGI